MRPFPSFYPFPSDPFPAFSLAQAQLERITAYRNNLTATAIAARSYTEGAVAAVRRSHDMIDRLTSPLTVRHVMPPVSAIPRTPRMRNLRDLPTIRGDWTN